MNPPVQRCLDILELLADAPGGLALSAIGAALGLPKSATHRFLAALADRGFVRQDPGSLHYALTLKLAALGFRHLSGTRLDEVCPPVLDRLAAETGELVRLAVVDGDGMTWVAKAQGAHSGLRYDPDMGRDVVLHVTASGRAWLATLDESDALALVARRGFAAPGRFGPAAPTTIATFRTLLRETRRRGGIGEAIEEGAPGVAAVAAPIRASEAADAPVVGTLSIAGPVSRLTPARRAQFARDLVAAAAELTQLWPIRRHVAAEPAMRGMNQHDHAHAA